MDDVYARLSTSGAVLCGRPGDDGRFTCDEPLAEVVRVPHAAGPPERRLASLDGWAQDKKGVWQATTRVVDLRRRGIAPARLPPERRTFVDFPALVRCPKCRAVQWLDAERLRVASDEGGARRSPSRWVVWQ